MEHIENVEIAGANGKPILIDIFNPLEQTPRPLVLFNHGFKGFKDWGYWNLLGKAFASKGFIFIKFNQSHSGTTVDQPLDFTDLKAFGRNSYTQELTDLRCVCDWLFNNQFVDYSSFSHGQVTLMGHSRGGSTALLYGSTDERIKKVVSWAGFKSIEERWNNTLYADWKQNGVVHIPNSRTGQEMPQYYSIYEDYMAHKDDFNIEKAVKSMNKPSLIVHGVEDGTVLFQDAITLKSWNPKAELCLVPNANHVFGGSHPYTEPLLPEYAQIAFEKTVEFLRN